MRKIFFGTIITLFVSSQLFAGCMKTELTQLDNKLKNSAMSEEKKNEVSKLRDLVAKNEHSNSELAFKSYEKALRILNEI